MKCAWKELLSILPNWLRGEVDRQGRDTLQEIRLRRQQPAVLVCQDGRHQLRNSATPEDLQFVLHTASQYSPWTATSLPQGYLTAPGGHRIGVCGQALLRNGQMDGISSISSLNIRVARDFPGISSNLGLRKEGMLILGPPGSGKTTLLRDLIRQRSSRENISVIDERGEIFPPVIAFDTGPNTDIMTGCSKVEGVTVVLRSMNPACIAVDEITAQSDCDALLQAGWCGVSLLATAHAADLSDLRSRPVYKPLVTSGLFKTAIILRRDKSWYTERICL